MRTVRAIYKAGMFKLLDPVQLPEDAAVTLAVLSEDDIPAAGITEAASSGGAFDFLDDPREDIYSLKDGEPA